MRISICLALLLLANLSTTLVAEDKVSDGAVITLLDAGEGERHLLRYRFAEGATETVVTKLAMSMVTEMNGQAMPAMGMPTIITTMRMNVAEVMDNGDALLTFEFVEMDVEATDPAQQQFAPMFKQQMATIVGTKSKYIASPNGHTRDFQMDLPENAPPHIAQMLNGMEQSVEQVLMPLPDEAVGVGARWQMDMNAEFTGIALNSLGIVTVDEVSADGFAATMQMEQSAESQVITMPGQNQQVTIESFKGQGEGKLQVNLSRLVPHSTFEMDNETTMSQSNQTFKSKMTMRMTIEPQE